MKDPAYLFYSSDFLTGCASLTMEERGQYITLLCLEHQLGRLSEKTIRLSVGSVSVDVLAKFKQDENGLLYNERLEIEIEKRANFIDTRRNNGLKGGRPRKTQENPKNPLGLNETQITHKDKDNNKENENDITPTAKQKSFKSLTEDEFKRTLIPFVQQFGKKTVREFFDYWTEPTPSGKMRFQLEKAWDAKRRLTTWKRNEKDFGNNTANEKPKTIPAGVWNV